MRIGVDSTSWQNERGYGRFVRGLVSAAVEVGRDHEWVLFMDRTDGAPPPARAEVFLHELSVPTTAAATATGNRSPRDLWRVSRNLSRADVDVIVFPTRYSFVPVFGPARKLVFFHDTIPEDYPELAMSDARARLLWNLKSRLARWQADAILTSSEYSRGKLHRLLGIPAERLFVVTAAPDRVFRPVGGARDGSQERGLDPGGDRERGLDTRGKQGRGADSPGKQERRLDSGGSPQRDFDPGGSPQRDVDPGGCLERLGLDPGDRWITFCGGFSPHKNLRRLVRAFAALAPELPDLRLVLVGERDRETFHTEYKDIDAMIRSSTLADRVVFTGHVTDEELVVLLGHSTVVTLPSLVEGFGLPAVEAAACGRPVVATRESPLPELLGDGGLWIDPLDEDDLREALRRVVESPELQASMGKAALEAASRITWELAAEQLLEACTAVMERPARRPAEAATGSPGEGT